MWYWIINIPILQSTHYSESSKENELTEEIHRPYQNVKHMKVGLSSLRYGDALLIYLQTDKLHH